MLKPLPDFGSVELRELAANITRDIYLVRMIAILAACWITVLQLLSQANSLPRPRYANA